MRRTGTARAAFRSVLTSVIVLAIGTPSVPVVAYAETQDEIQEADVLEAAAEDGAPTPPEGYPLDQYGIEASKEDEANSSEDLESEDDQPQPEDQPSDVEITPQAIIKDISDGSEWEIYGRSTSFYEDGNPHSPTGTMITSYQDDEWIELVEGQDFVLDYCLDSRGNKTDGEPVEAGEYVAFYKGINGYTGMQSLPFSIISERSLDEALFSIGRGIYLYTGSEAKTAPRVKDDVTGEMLVEGRDYRIEYRDAKGRELTGIPVQAGIYSALAVGTGDYTGKTHDDAFEIVSADNAQTLSFGKSYSGSFTASRQRATFTFTLPSSGTIRLSGQAPENTKALVFGPDGLLVLQMQSYESGTVDLSSLSAFAFVGGRLLNAGTYTLLIGQGAIEDSGGAPMGDYTLSMSFTPVKESFAEGYGGSDNTFESANAAQFGKKYAGLLAFGDTTDCYVFDAQAGGTASIELDAYKPMAVAHLYLTMYDEDGNEEWSGYNYWDEEHQAQATTSDMDHWSLTGIDLKPGRHYLRISNGQTDDTPFIAAYFAPYEFEVDLRSSDASFSDVTASTAHADDISWLAEQGISKGWPMADGTVEFRPLANVARADMAAFLFRLAKSWGLVDESWQPSGSASFLDVTAKTAHYREVMWLAESGISQGWTVSGGKEFRPYANVARADMAAFLSRLQALREQGAPLRASASGTSPFRDVTGGTAHYADILWLAESGISQGWTVSGGKEFRPYANVARADMAAFLHRMDALQ